MTDCIFCKIVDKALPAQIVYEDQDFLAFNDLYPSAPVHVLLIPKTHITSLAHLTPTDEALMGRMMLKIQTLAKEQGLAEGYKTQINTGKKGGQEVPHLHIHIMGTPDSF